MGGFFFKDLKEFKDFKDFKEFKGFKEFKDSFIDSETSQAAYI